MYYDELLSGYIFTRIVLFPSTCLFYVTHDVDMSKLTHTFPINMFLLLVKRRNVYAVHCICNNTYTTVTITLLFCSLYINIARPARLPDLGLPGVSQSCSVFAIVTACWSLCWC